VVPSSTVEDHLDMVTIWMVNLIRVMKKTTGMNHNQVTQNKTSPNAKKGENLNLKIEQSIRVSGKEAKDMGMVNRSGQMVLSMKANGKRIRLTEKEYFGMCTETNMKDNGRETKLMVKENILIVMVLHMKECGRTIYNMAKGKNIGTIIQNTLVFTQKVKNMELDATHGMMDQNIMETGKKIKYME
jgi:hypothetical protein